MVDTVINIVNYARNRIGLTNLSTTDLDSAQDRESIMLRAEFRRAYRDLVDLKNEDFRKTFTLTTVAGTNGYALGFDPRELSSTELYMQTSALTQGFALNYLTENEGRTLYPDFDDIPSGLPSAYFIATTNTANTFKLYFINKPDNVYSMIGYQNVSISTDLTASQSTACNDSGDEYLENRLCSYLRRSQGYDDWQEFEKDAQASLNKYIGQEFHINQDIFFPLPRQRSYLND